MKWSARTICTFVAATVPVEKAGDVNPLLESAQQIGIDSDEKDDDKPRQEKSSVADNGVGSYERFMMTFGNPSRWAGRS